MAEKEEKEEKEEKDLQSFFGKAADTPKAPKAAAPPAPPTPQATPPHAAKVPILPPRARAHTHARAACPRGREGAESDGRARLFFWEGGRRPRSAASDPCVASSRSLEGAYVVMAVWPI